MIASTNAEGMVGVVMPHGVLFRGSSEKAIRQGIIEDDLLEAVVGLPSGLFYGTGIPACLLIINKNKPSERRGKVLFINGELEFEEGKNQNKLREQDIANIVETFENYSEIKRYSKVVPYSEIAENDFNLNIRRYADTSPPAEIFDVRAILHSGMNTARKQPEIIQGKGYVVEVVRTTRTKTASIKIEDGVVAVVVPRKLDIEKVEKLIEDKHTWIIEKIAIHREATPASDKQYVSGEALPYLGRNYRLKVLREDFSRTKLINGRITVSVPELPQQDYYIRNALVRWYKRNAELKIKDKVERYGKVVGVETGVVRIKDFKSRWGSCTPYGDLEFNWVIVMAPNRIVDYVVVHELCHLIHHDHSPQFWKEVERVMPDYQECKEWLKVNSSILKL